MTAAFGIERRAVQRDLDLVAFHRFFHTRVAFHDRLHRPVRVQFQIAEKLSRRDDAADVGIYGLGLGDFEPSALARALPLLFEGFLKSGLIQRQSLISRRIGCEVQGEAIGIVEFEQCLAGNDRLLRPLDVRDHLIEQAKSLVQGVEKPFLFSLRDMLDRRTMPFQLGIGALHPNNHGFRQAMEKRPVEAETERPPIAPGPAEDAPEDIPAAFVRRQNAVRDHEADRPQVIRDHSHRPVVIRGDAIPLSRHARNRADDRLEQIGVVVIGLALGDGGETLEAHARIDAGFGQRVQCAFVIAVELHEDQVPDFDDPVAIPVRHGIARDRRALVVVDLGTWSAGTGLRHLPEIILLPASHDAGRRHADLLPERKGLIILAEDGDP